MSQCPYRRLRCEGRAVSHNLRRAPDGRQDKDGDDDEQLGRLRNCWWTHVWRVVSMDAFLLPLCGNVAGAVFFYTLRQRSISISLLYADFP